ncbi:hypothetical protein FJT64_017657 [Amphibalanus amphitrite]|uniref:Endonuclease/exonuclease/phosphatase domain-containing protein n=1 Tax=Amphibalanus amphitrite TaxID=1232801 RepID=A0A6A4X005_AMPAM|nr:hypothetical protein FJT64_017657 [Amphibalanus amphitrite]
MDRPPFRPSVHPGDVNIDLLQPTSTGVQQYQTLLDELSLCQVISSPTRTTPSTATLIDHVVTSRPELTSHPRVIDCSFSDHDAVAVNISIKRARQRAQTITVRSTRRVNWDGLNFDLLMADWSLVYSAATTAAKWEQWLQVSHGRHTRGEDRTTTEHPGDEDEMSRECLVRGGGRERMGTEE